MKLRKLRLFKRFCVFGGDSAYSTGVILRVRRVVACLLIVVGVQYCFNVLIINRPNDATYFVLQDDGQTASQKTSVHHLSDPISYQLKSDQGQTGRRQTGGQIGMQSSLLSFLAKLLVEFFSSSIPSSVKLLNASLPLCPLPVNRPVEHIWSLDNSLPPDVPTNPLSSSFNTTHFETHATFRPVATGVDSRFSAAVKPGGRWRPSNCTARQSIAIVVPYRNRPAHLHTFINHMHPFLQRQVSDYTIYVVEQTDERLFNRGMLLNVGFIESRRLSQQQHDCYFFHDVDLLPENDRNLYTCPDQPRHMSAAISTMSYQLPYANLFGGVEAFRTEHFQQVNGFSNRFFGWGGEDDDLYRRLTLLESGIERMDVDGLNSLCYEMVDVSRLPLYTRFLVDLLESNSTQSPHQDTIGHQCPNRAL